MVTGKTTLGGERLKSIRKALRRLGVLYLTNAKLTLAERLTVLLSAALLVILGIVLGAFALVFFAAALAGWLSEVLPVGVAYVIVGGIFLLLILAVILLRGPLIVNPIARFVSRLVLSNNDEFNSDISH